MSDICDHPYCRNVVAQLSAALAHHFGKVQVSGPEPIGDFEVALTSALEQADVVDAG
ncbi:unnamed protein product [Ectocarpus sp. 12 AP-2014]